MPGGSGGIGGSGGVGGEEPWRGLLPANQAWLLDPSIWRRVLDGPGAVDCPVRTADPERMPALKLDWSGCGPACEKATVDGGLLDPNFYPSIPGEAFTTAIPGDRVTILLSFSQSELASDHRMVKMRRVVGLEEPGIDEAIQVFGKPRECTLGGGPIASMVHLISGSPLQHRYANLDSTRSAWSTSNVWGSTQLPLCLSASALVPGGQMVFACGDVLATLDPAEPEFTSIRPGRVVMVQGFGDLAIMAELTPDVAGTNILSWTVADGFRSVASGIEGDTCGLAVSSTRVAGISGEAYKIGGACVGSYSGSRLWAFSRSDPTSVTYGPVLHEKALQNTGVATWGDFVATRVWAEEASDDFIALAHLPDWKTRVIHYAEGTAFLSNVLALDEKYLYVGMSRTNNLESSRLSWVERYDLSRFDEIGAPLGP